jgi:predicted glycoside hydrolase/deacetylase ChbG (UPF0249 family)
MSKLLIVNADDFGLCEEISKGIIKAYQEGIVTSTSVVTNGKYFEKGIPLLKESGIDTGVHLTFIDGEKPLCGPIDGLVDEQGFFLKKYTQVIPKILLNRYNKKAFKNELVAQTSRLKDSGLNISHIDAHQHLHILPNLRDVLIQLAKYFNIEWIRIPHSKKWGIKGIGINLFSSILKLGLKGCNLRYSDRCEGFDTSGFANEAILSQTLNTLQAGATELVIHPGYDASAKYDWGYQWNDELMALTSKKIKMLVQKNKITLTNYSKLI